MDAREIAEWKAYYHLEPFGQDRQDAGAAIVAHTVAVTMGGAKDARPADFLPRFDGDGGTRRQSGADMLAAARGFVSRLKASRGHK